MPPAGAEVIESGKATVLVGWEHGELKVTTAAVPKPSFSALAGARLSANVLKRNRVDKLAGRFRTRVATIKEAITCAGSSLDKLPELPAGFTPIVERCVPFQSFDELVLATVPAAVRMVWGGEAGDRVEEALKTYHVKTYQVKRTSRGTGGTKRKSEALRVDDAQELDNSAAMLEDASGVDVVRCRLGTDGSSPSAAAPMASSGTAPARQRPSAWSAQKQHHHNSGKSRQTLARSAIPDAPAVVHRLPASPWSSDHQQAHPGVPSDPPEVLPTVAYRSPMSTGPVCRMIGSFAPPPPLVEYSLHLSCPHHLPAHLIPLSQQAYGVPELVPGPSAAPTTARPWCHQPSQLAPAPLASHSAGALSPRPPSPRTRPARPLYQVHRATRTAAPQTERHLSTMRLTWCVSRHQSLPRRPRALALIVPSFSDELLQPQPSRPDGSCGQGQEPPMDSITALELPPVYGVTPVDVAATKVWEVIRDIEPVKVVHDFGNRLCRGKGHPLYPQGVTIQLASGDDGEQVLPLIPIHLLGMPLPSRTGSIKHVGFLSQCAFSQVQVAYCWAMMMERELRKQGTVELQMSLRARERNIHLIPLMPAYTLRGESAGVVWALMFLQLPTECAFIDESVATGLITLGGEVQEVDSVLQKYNGVRGWARRSTYPALNAGELPKVDPKKRDERNLCQHVACEDMHDVIENVVKGWRRLNIPSTASIDYCKVFFPVLVQRHHAGFLAELEGWSGAGNWTENRDRRSFA